MLHRSVTSISTATRLGICMCKASVRIHNSSNTLYSPFRAENGPCGYVVVPIESGRTKFIWIINSNLKVSIKK